MFAEIILIDFAAPLAKRKDSRRFVGPYRWTPSEPGKGRGFYCGSSETETARHGAGFRLRLDLANDHLSGSRLSNINGYFCDHDGDGDTLRPIVARLPRSRGFLAGWTMGSGMCASLENYIYADAESAARAAHDMAEYDAERNRESSEEDEDESEMADA